MTSRPRPEDVAQALRAGVPPSALLDEANGEPPAGAASPPAAVEADPRIDRGLEETGPGLEETGPEETGPDETGRGGRR